jgi:NADH dehydrogenase [ubiquinone] 1 alpha subcomplex assembly factor 6
MKSAMATSAGHLPGSISRDGNRLTKDSGAGGKDVSGICFLIERVGKYNAVMDARAPNSGSRLSLLGQIARAGDYDRFLVTLFAPPEKREALFALTAFNLEIARIRDVVREPMLGQIRLQWWREAFTEAKAGKPRRHDVLEGLSLAGIPEPLIEEMLTGREIEYAPEPPATLAEFRAYAAGTSGALSEAMAAALGGGDTLRAAARAVGTAFGMIGTLRATAFQARHGRVLLSSDILEEAGTSIAAIKERRTDPGLAKAAQRIASAAKQELVSARSLEVSVDKTSRAPLLLAPLTEAYLAQVGRARFDLLNSDTTLTPLRKQIAVGWANLRGKF